MIMDLIIGKKEWLLGTYNMYLVFSLLFFFSLFGSVNEPLRLELFSGYRNAKAHWHLNEPAGEGALIYREKYPNVHFWENGVSLRAISRDLLFFVEGSFSAPARGSLSQGYGNTPGSPSPPTFSFPVCGWGAQGRGFFGYTINLTQDRTYKTILAPLIGYSVHLERWKRKGVSTFSSGAFSMNSSLPDPFSLNWYGFFFGGMWIVEPGGPLDYGAGYSYHILDQKFHSNYQTEIGSSATLYRIKAKGGAMGQSGWLFFDFSLGDFWKLSLHGGIHYFSTDDISAKRASSGLVMREKYKMRWNSIFASFGASRQL